MPLQVDPPNAAGILGLEELPFPVNFGATASGGPRSDQILPGDEAAIVKAWQSLSAWSVLLASLAYIVPAPTGDPVVDTANIQAGLDSGAYEVILRAGTYRIGGPPSRTPTGLLQFANDRPLLLRGQGMDKTLLSSSVNNATPYNAAIIGYGTNGAPTVINANITGGTSDQIGSVTDLAKGSWVILGNANSSAIYQIIGKAGGGPFTYTVDRTIEYTYAIGDALIPTVPPRDIIISDFTITQTSVAGLRAWNFVGAVRCLVRRIGVSDAGGLTPNQGGSFDSNCLDCWYEDARALSPLAGQFASIESSERCGSRRLRGDNCAIGVYIIDSYDCEVHDASASQCTGAGLKIGTAGGPLLGSRNIRVFGGQFDHCQTGVVVGKSQGVTFDGTAADHAIDEGFNFGNIETVSDITANNIRAQGAAGTANIHVYASAVRTLGTNWRTANAASIGILLQGEAKIDGVSQEGDFLAFYDASSTGGPVSAARVRQGTGINTGVTVTSTIRLTLRDAELGGGTVIDHQGAGEVELDNVSTATTGGGTRGYVGAAGSTLRMIGRVNFDTTATKFTINGAGFVSRSVVDATKAITLNGVNLVSIAYPTLKTGDVPKLTLASKAGTGTGLAPVIAVVPGTGFNIPAASQVAGDTSVWNWEL